MNFIPALFVFVKTWETAKMTRNKQAEQRLVKEKKLTSGPVLSWPIMFQFYSNHLLLEGTIIILKII